ncbi:MAG: hypothetical protein AB1758_26540 [Candidatus Eremiobacterota bacterium]
MLDFNGLFGGVFVGLLALVASQMPRALPFPRIYLVGALLAWALYLISRGRKLVVDGPTLVCVDYLLKVIPLFRREYPAGSFDHILVRPAGELAWFIELKGSSYLAITQTQPLSRALGMAGEIGAATGLPVRGPTPEAA